MSVDFALNVRRWVEKIPGKVELVTYAIGLAVVERVKELTPVDTGFLRSSWALVNEEELTALEAAARAGASSVVSDITRIGVQAGATAIPLKVVQRAAGVAGVAAGFVAGGLVAADQGSLEGTVGGLAASYAGAAIGGAVGSSFFGIGALPGAILGGAVGSIAGTLGGDQFAGAINEAARGTALERPISALNSVFGDSKTKLGTILYIVNPAPYARRIEYGFVGEDSLGRTYDYKGVGMMQQTLAELPAIADRVISGLRL